MSLTEINIREKNFHNNLQSQKKDRFEGIFYKAIYNINEDFFSFLEKNAQNSEILDYGCGVGSFVDKVIKFKPKKIVGIDISEISINKAKKKAEPKKRKKAAKRKPAKKKKAAPKKKKKKAAAKKRRPAKKKKAAPKKKKRKAAKKKKRR